MTAVAWLGIDPGVTHSGLVLRAGPDLLGWDVVTRTDDESIAAGPRGLRIGPRYIRRVLDSARILAATAAGAGLEVRVAVEWLNAPTGHARDGKVRQVQPRDLVAAAIVTGAVVGAYPDATIVPPAHAGQGLLAHYPAELVTPRERLAGLNRPAGESSAVSHAREAWDVAGAAPQTWRLARSLEAFERARGGR